MKEKIIDNNRAIILCRRGKCCPIITEHKSEKEKYITISDDYNGLVKLNMEQAEDLKKAISKFLN